MSWLWISLGGVSVAGLIAAAWFIPFTRKYAVAAALGLGALLAAYIKGARDNAESERRKRDAAVERARRDYDKIDSRPDDTGTVDKRLRDGRF